MQTEICNELGIDVPIFAFTHCRDVVVAVSKASGLGVLGAVSFTPEQLREELDWIEAWARDDTPDPRPMPLQGLVTIDAIQRTSMGCYRTLINHEERVVNRYG